MHDSNRQQDCIPTNVVERLPVIVFRLDRRLRLLYVNSAVTTILGRTPDELLGRTGLEAGVDPEQWAAFQAACEKVFATKAPTEADFVARTSQGTRYFEAHLFPEPDAQNATPCLLGIMTDR